MSGKRYTEEFKIAAIKQVAERLGVSMHSLYAWMKRYGVPEEERKAVDSQAGYKFPLNTKRRVSWAGEPVEYLECDSLQSHVTKLYRGRGLTGRFVA